MHLLEVREDFILGDPLLAFKTFQVSILAVNIKMFLLVRWLTECHPAALHWTNIRFFQSVGAKMIKEIIPFSEVHLAVFLVARVYIRSATSLRVEEFHMAESSSVGNVSLAVENLHVNALPKLLLKGRVDGKIEMFSKAALNSFSWIGTCLDPRALFLIKVFCGSRVIWIDFFLINW